MDLTLEAMVLWLEQSLAGDQAGFDPSSFHVFILGTLKLIEVSALP